MKKGDVIVCSGPEDLKQTMEDLSIAGFHAVHDSGSGYRIRITGTPDPEYLVEAHDQNGRCQKAYSSTLEEAEEAAAEYGNSYEFVEILKGYPGEWETVSQSW